MAETAASSANGASSSRTISFSPANSTPPTPGERADADGMLVPPNLKRAMASFENLVAMANHQERLKEARKMVWRDRGQPVIELETFEACLAHAMSGGFSKSTYSFNSPYGIDWEWFRCI